jgi:hypothetical protein
LEIRRPDIYKGWNCALCNTTPETADHLWTCPSNQDKLINISAELMDFADDLLLSKINNNGLQSYYSFKQQFLESFNFTSNPIKFTQLVKGLILRSLVIHLRSIFSQSIVNQILVTILGKLNDSIYELIWIPHCKAMVSKEQSLNIGTKQKKKKVKYKVNGRSPSNLRKSSVDYWKT